MPVGSGIAFGCSYAYRNQPFMAGQSAGVGSPGAQPMWSCFASSWRLHELWPNLVIAGTDPTGYGNHHLFDVMPSPRYVKLNNTGPERKTTKMLGDRSIVADRFGKRSEYDSSFSESTPWDVEAAYDRKYPGDGAYAHKEGYNVLYGDGHCGWYGDPQGQIIWMGFPQQAHNNGWGPGNQTVGIGWCYECAPGIGFFNWFDKPIDSATVWNDWARADQ